MQRLLAAVGTLVLSAGLIVAVPAGASAQEPIGRIAVCEHRVCLVLVEDDSDSDGDGVADVDEDTLGSDALDPDSFPEVVELLDLVLERQLPSFDERVTELVVLPRNTPDGRLATAFGALDLPEEGSSVLDSDEGFFDQARSNGFDYLGVGVITWFTDSELSDSQWLPLAMQGGVAIGLDQETETGIGSVYGPNRFGANADRDPSGFSGLGFSYGEGGVLRHEYSVSYTDGAWDDVTTWTTAHLGTGTTDTTLVGASYHEDGWQSGSTDINTKSNTWTTENGWKTVTTTTGTVTSEAYNEDGDKLGSGTTDYHHRTTKTGDGHTTDETYTSTTNYDADGNQTDRTTVTTTKETSSDGTSRTTSKTTTYRPDESVAEKVETETVDDGETTTSNTTKTTYDEDGNEESETETETCDNANNGCTVTTGDGETGIPNPNSVELGPVTAADLARVAARVNSHRTPSKDDYGEIGDLPPGGVQGGYNPMVALVNPDGVSTFAAGGPPKFNGASPDYDPDLADVIETSGVNPPGTEPVSWPGD